MAQASTEKLELGLPQRVATAPQSEQLARTPEPPLTKGKNRAILSNDKIVRWAGTLARKKDQSGNTERSDSFTVKEDEFQGWGKQRTLS